MSETVNGTTNSDGGTSAADDSQTGASTDAQGGDSQAGGDDSVWQSRFNGLNGKFGVVSNELKAEKEARARLEAEIADLRSGKTTADEAAKAQVASIQAELAKERAERALENRKAKFPETFRDVENEADLAALAVMSDAQLAALEARLAGGESPEGGTPLKHNESRISAGAKKPAEETAADVEARLMATPLPWA